MNALDKCDSCKAIYLEADCPHCPIKKSVSREGTKLDNGKPRLELLSNIWLRGVGAVLGFGAAKPEYGAHNWRKGLLLSRTLGAALRHILAFQDGEDLDVETGLNHLDHASCELMFARELFERRKDLDDRYKAPK